jgi:hypothetical protein
LPGRQHLTPAADIYSLAKTTYTLLAGEPPRRFSQRAITELPQFIGDHYWGQRVLGVLERATRSRAEDRYQTVQEFWEEFADATLPDTRELPASMDADAQRLITADLNIEPEEITQAPPWPHFAVSPIAGPLSESVSSIPRPRIVVPVTKAQLAQTGNGVLRKPTASQLIAAFPDQQTKAAAGSFGGRAPVPHGQIRVVTRGRRFLVAMCLVLGFSGMLLATHRYVTSHWNPLVDLPALANTFIVGREGVTSTDVNLRGDPSTDNQPVGLAENGSRVRVLSVNGNWYEVQVLQHGRPKVDQYALEQGWMNKKYLKLD